MSIVILENLSYDKLKKRLVSQINLDDWADECVKCGYPKLLHKELHNACACTKEQEVSNILIKNWAEYRKRIKPLLKELKEAKRKDIEQGENKELILAMKEIRQGEKELKITQDEWFAAWMLIWIMKRKNIDNHNLSLFGML